MYTTAAVGDPYTRWFFSYTRNYSYGKSIEPAMSTKRKGSGRLVPTRPTGVEYRVNYGLHIVVEAKQHGRGIRPARWTRCSVKSANANRIPEGNYFLHADEGGVFQVKSTGKVWQYLAAA